MNRSFAVICFTVALDAIGIGLVMPVLPSLLQSLGHRGGEVAGHYGFLLSAYAVMQFLCSPLLGALSDRFGRRPVLLASLAGGTIDYLIMASTPYLWLLYATRIGRHPGQALRPDERRVRHRLSDGTGSGRVAGRDSSSRPVRRGGDPVRDQFPDGAGRLARVQPGGDP
jgi:MFS family permease